MMSVIGPVQSRCHEGSPVGKRGLRWDGFVEPGVKEWRSDGWWEWWVNQAVRDLPRHFHFMDEYSKIDRVKTMGTRGKINAIWWNIKMYLWKLVDICGYELPTNLQHFTQKYLTEVKIFQKKLGELLFSETPCSILAVNFSELVKAYYMDALSVNETKTIFLMS